MKEFQILKKPYVEEILRITLHDREIFNIPKRLLINCAIERTAELERIPVTVLMESLSPKEFKDFDAFYGVTFSNGSTYYKFNYTSAFKLDYDKKKNAVSFSVVRILPLEFDEVTAGKAKKQTKTSKKVKS